MVWAKKERHIIDSCFYDNLYESWKWPWKWKTIHFYKYFLYSYHRPGDMLSPGETRWTATWFTRKSWAPQPSKVRSESQEQKEIALKLSYTSLRWARDADMGTSFCSKLQHGTKPNITIKSLSSLLTADTSPVPTGWALNLTLHLWTLPKVIIYLFWSMLPSPTPIFVTVTAS